MENLPIVDPGSDHPKRKQLADMASRLQVLYTRLQQVKTASDKTLITRQAQALDRQVDHLVYDIYGLSPADVMAVETAP